MEKLIIAIKLFSFTASNNIYLLNQVLNQVNTAVSCVEVKCSELCGRV